MKIILGSTSKQRKEILSFFSLPYEEASPIFDESRVIFHGDPKQYVLTLAEGKNHSLVAKYSDRVILTADTIVFQDGKVYGKPCSYEEAFFTLKQLAGKWHHVFTGVCLQKNKQIYSAVEETKVLLYPLTDHQIEQYLSHLSYLEKAAGYAIQKAGSLAIEKIEGCYYNVMGLPIQATNQLLNQIGIQLWDYLT